MEKKLSPADLNYSSFANLGVSIQDAGKQRIEIQPSAIPYRNVRIVSISNNSIKENSYGV